MTSPAELAQAAELSSATENNGEWAEGLEESLALREGWRDTEDY